MKVDTEHIHYWMQAIRNSPDPIRTMDAFWKGQIKSKEWLIETLEKILSEHPDMTIEIHGGWVGLLASLLFQSNLKIKKITSIDVDPVCEPIAIDMNKGEEIIGKFSAVTTDMCEYPMSGDLIINTSCEHLTEDNFNLWIKNLPLNSFVVLQSNNYNIPEHIRLADSLWDFEKQASGIEILWSGELDLPLYKRWMIIGKKCSNLTN